MPPRAFVAAQLTAPGRQLRVQPIEPVPPGAGQVRIEVRASDICGADLETVDNPRSNVSVPIVPGHEIAGTIAELGEHVRGWQIGDRVAVGWFGGSCGHCSLCRRGNVVHCAQRRTPGRSYPGGWAESLTVPADALARIPDGLDFVDAAPMGCAGVTTFNAIRHAGVAAGGRIAVFGFGGLGHLAVQFAAKMGYEVVVIARVPNLEKVAYELGAHHYIDSHAVDAGKELERIGGADLILSTAPATAPLGALLAGLRTQGRLILIGVDGDCVQVPAAQLTMNAQSLSGHLTGSAVDIEETMRFALLTGVRPMVEVMPLEGIAEALKRLRSGRRQFRIVLDTKSTRDAGSGAR
ncbi:alcohol dehydrogenase catalytic domain-containing protein (plasmid) [Rhodococcus sp. M8-50]|uniref:alcohol dehydrogenase catalytic domain-containing protein n=1 Tax=unclassified Rhodococcus (in: high G+C Gram-positive bacteria) TaxID=192944 RepID=UPI000929C795|nr:alcohol dehydrogenase catalytic domain-containing protein [Rhodococcus sp. M8]OLL16093.1 alcohol dehydrogenase [Rhodococcus sp. M8]